MRRVLAALPWLLLTAALGVGGWIAWDLVGPKWGTLDLDGEAAGTTTITTTTTTTTTLPPGLLESCEASIGMLIDEGYAVMQEVGAVTRAVDEVEAGTGSWVGVAETARVWLIPRLEGLRGLADQVLAADPDTVSRITATAFRDAAIPLLEHAGNLVGRVVDPVSGQVDEASWAAWWHYWLDRVQDLIALLDRAPASAGNCPD